MSPQRCKKIVYRGGWVSGSQCQREAKVDGYCRQHHPEAVAAQRKASDERYEARRKEEAIAAIERAARLLRENGWAVTEASRGVPPTEGHPK